MVMLVMDCQVLSLSQSRNYPTKILVQNDALHDIYDHIWLLHTAYRYITARDQEARG